MQMMSLLSRICFWRGHMRKIAWRVCSMEDRAIVRYNRSFLLDESHDTQAFHCVGLEGWGDEMMESDRERESHTSLSH